MDNRNHHKNQKGIWAVIPVKRFDQAKKRLSPLLNADERRQLSRVMLGDVLSAVSQSRHLSGIVVVTCNREAMEMAHAHGAEVLAEDASHGLCEAVASAGQYLKSRGCAGMISIPGDVPLVSSDDIDHVILSHGTAPAVTLVPAWDGGGTNVLVCTPADVIELHFGENSSSAHKAAADKAGLSPKAMSSPSLELDLDTPNDLYAFLERGSHTNTARYLNSIIQAPELKRGLG